MCGISASQICIWWYAEISEEYGLVLSFALRCITSFEKHGSEARINERTYIACVNHMLQYHTLYDQMLRNIEYLCDWIQIRVVARKMIERDGCYLMILFLDR